MPKVTTEVDVPWKMIENLLCCAFEGGSNYWYFITRFVKPKNFRNSSPDNVAFKHLSYPINDGGCLMINCTEKLGGEAHSIDVFKLDLAAINKGLKIMASEHKGHFNDMVSENEDAVTGDVFLQCCLFGDTIYG